MTWAIVVAVALLAGTFSGVVPPVSAITVVGVLPAALVDVRTRRLPDHLVALAALVLAAGLVVGSVLDRHVADVAGVAAGAALFAGPLLAAHLLSPPAMGFGDVKAAVVLGAAIGVEHWQLALPALAIAAALTAMVAVVLRLRSVPLGPGLVSGAAAALLATSVMVPAPDAGASADAPSSEQPGHDGGAR